MENFWGVSKEIRSSEEPGNSYSDGLVADLWHSEREPGMPQLSLIISRTFCSLLQLPPRT